MNIRTDDYVTLKSFDEIKPFYKFCDMVNDGTVITNTDYFTAEMLDAMGTSNKYKVIEANQDGVWIDIKGKMWCFDEKCIKGVYKLVKVKQQLQKGDMEMKAFFRIVESGYTKDFKVIYKIYCYEKREMLHNSFKSMNVHDMKRLHIGAINKEGNKQYILTDKTGDEILEAIYRFYDYETMAYIFE